MILAVAKGALGRSPLDGTQLQAQWKDPTGALNFMRTVVVDLAMSASFMKLAMSRGKGIGTAAARSKSRMSGNAAV